MLNAILAVGYALGSFTLVFQSSHYLKPIVQLCAKQEFDGFLPVGIKSVDSFLCFITPFFEAVLSEPSGTPVMFLLINLLAVGMAFSCIESLRQSSRWFVKHPAIVFQVGQFVGISVSFPLLFISSYHTRKRSPVTPSGVVLAAICTIVSVFIAMMTVFGENSRLWSNIFQFFPLVAILMNIFTFTGYIQDPKTAQRGSAYTEFFYRVVGASTVIFHYYTLYLFYELPNGWLALDYDKSSTYSTVVFLMFDYVSLLGSFLWIATLEHGFKGFVKFLGRSLVVGPAEKTI